MTEAFLERFRAWAGARPDVRGVVLIGSQARDDCPADEWSDVDLVVIVEDPRRLLLDDEWPSLLGDPLLALTEETPVGGAAERRVLYAGGLAPRAGRCEEARAR